MRKPKSEAHKEKIRQAKLGKKLSEEQKYKNKLLREARRSISLTNL
jgi:hypothetical protein